MVFKVNFYLLESSSIESLKKYSMFFGHVCHLERHLTIGKLLSQYLKLNLKLVGSVPVCLFLFILMFYQSFLVCGLFYGIIEEEGYIWLFLNPNSFSLVNTRYMIFTLLKAIKTILLVKC